LVVAVPPAVGVVVAVVVAAAAPAAEAAVGAVAVATPCNGHTRYLGHRDIIELRINFPAWVSPPGTPTRSQTRRRASRLGPRGWPGRQRWPRALWKPAARYGAGGGH
jgi:hypothetical protein